MRKLLSVILLTSLLLSVISCGDSGSKTADDNSSPSSEGEQTSVETATETTTEDPYVYINTLAEVDMEGAEIHFIAFDGGYQEMIINDIDTDSETGAALNDALYRRNRQIEEQYNCVIVTAHDEDSNKVTTTLTKEEMSGECLYDIIDNTTVTMASAITGGYLIDMANLPYVDYSQPWWLSDAVNNLSIAKENFVTISYANHLANDVAWGTMFNKYLFDSYGFEYPYQAVKDGKWTLDMMNELMKVVPIDSNGNGMTDGDDMFGCIGQYFDAAALMTGFGVDYFRKDNDDIPYFALDEASNADKFDKCFDFMTDDAKFLIVEKYNGKYSNVWDEIWAGGFINDRGLFMLNCAGNLISFTNMDHDFGFLPMPKLDENQQNYRSMTSLWFTTCFGVSSGHKNSLENIGLMLEAMSFYSYTDVEDIYNRTYLSNRFIRDEESVEMLALISSSKHFDPGLVFNWNGALQTAQNIISGGKNTFASTVAKNKQSVDKSVEKTVSSIEGQ